MGEGAKLATVSARGVVLDLNVVGVGGPTPQDCNLALAANASESIRNALRLILDL
jgi:hypothetical protein